MIDELPFKVVRSNGTDEVLARAMNLRVARTAYREAARQYPEDLIESGEGYTASLVVRYGYGRTTGASDGMETTDA
jgi:hypothetical protein